MGANLECTFRIFRHLHCWPCKIGVSQILERSVRYLVFTHEIKAPRSCLHSTECGNWFISHEVQKSVFHCHSTGMEHIREHVRTSHWCISCTCVSSCCGVTIDI